MYSQKFDGIYHKETETIDSKIKTFYNRWENLIGPFAIQMAIAKNGKLVYHRSYGYATHNGANSIDVTNDHWFRLGSVTKTITASAINHLVSKGLINFDDQVFGVNGILNQYNYRNISDSDIYKITIRNLLEHKIGSGRGTKFGGCECHNKKCPADTSMDAIVQQFINCYRQEATIGVDTHYSNVAFNILARVIEKVTRTKYIDYIKKVVLEPSGATNFNLGITGKRLPNEVAYYLNPELTKVPLINDGGGDLVATAHDVVRNLISIERAVIVSNPLVEKITYPSHTVGALTNHGGALPYTARSRIGYRVNGKDVYNFAVLTSLASYSKGVDTLYNGEVSKLIFGIVDEMNTSGSNWPEIDMMGMKAIENKSYNNTLKSYKHEGFYLKDVTIDKTSNISMEAQGAIVVKNSFRVKRGGVFRTKVTSRNKKISNGKTSKTKYYTVENNDAKNINFLDDSFIVSEDFDISKTLSKDMISANNLIITNPSNNYMDIKFLLRDNSNLKLTITNIHGIIVFEDFDFSLSKGYKSKRINTVTLKSGIYLLRAVTDQFDEIRKVIIK